VEETKRNQNLKILSETRSRIEGNEEVAAILGIDYITLRARLYKPVMVRLETKNTDRLPSFKESLNILRLRQILRPNDSHNTLGLFSFVNLTICY
jgi:hypothetical protein